ncbi:hypothetical protein F5Y13DRAFT_153816 [Hypoxylon sp. FL1857]|nr:hypothetical protein F5Y13DRAFT_153816 [Hypoxylon sp. FL1857]
MVENREPRESRSGQTEGPDYITARRERGKLAQRAFRQRQIDTIRNLEHENQRLREAIAAISDAVGQNEVVLSLAISNARRVAGLPVTEAESLSTVPTVRSVEDSGWSSNASIGDTTHVSPVTPVAPVSSETDDILEFLMPSVGVMEPVDNWSQSYPADSSETYVSPTDFETFDSGIGMSTPRFVPTAGSLSMMEAPTASFEPDRALHITQPPSDIMPYMGAGAYTLAGQMYWSAMAFGFQAIKAIISTSTPPPAAVDIVADQFMHTLKLVTLPKIMYLMHSRLTFRRYGYFQLASDEHFEEIKSFLDPAMPQRISKALGEELEKSGVSKEDFLTPLDVERRLRDRFRDEYPVFEAALRGQALSAQHVACMRKLMQIMSRQSICFGDGPRWRPESVDTLANGWKLSTGSLSVY